MKMPLLKKPNRTQIVFRL